MGVTAVAEKKPPEHTFTIEDIDHLVQIAAALPLQGTHQVYADLVEKCKAIEPGHIVHIPIGGKVIRKGTT